MGFKGWPAEAFDFYAELEANNNRTWWQDHRETYDHAVRGPFEELMASVEDEFGPLRMFRPYRDTRFSADKSPYKTAAAAMTDTGGAAYYVQLSAEGLFVGGGMYHLAPDQLRRWRDAIADDDAGPTVVAITADLSADGYEIGAAETLTTAPRGWDKAHPRIELARLKGLVMSRSFPRAAWQSSAKAHERITGVWQDAQPMIDWLDANVGPSNQPARR